MHPDDRDEFRAHVRRLCPEHPAYTLCFRFCRRDGREVWLEEEARGEFDSEGRLLRVKGLTRDISERKRAELALAERTLQLTLAGKAALVRQLLLRNRHRHAAGLRGLRRPARIAGGDHRDLAAGVASAGAC